MVTQVTQLPSGLRIATYEMPQLQTASMGVWVRAGARNEDEQENGIAHFLEHMAFKGTKTRSALEIAETIEAVGGDINASTSLETTAYYVRVLKDDVPLGTEVLSDILLNPVFEKSELERERDVVVQEIAAAQDTPDDLVFDIAQQVAFPSQAIGRPILGEVERVSTFTEADICQFRDRHYVAGQTVVAAAGGIKHDEFVALATQAFGGLNGSKSHTWAPAQYDGGFSVVERPLEQTHLVMGFEGPGYLSEDIYAEQVMASVLGGGMSSRLFQEVREKRGLCYSIFAFPSAFEDTCLMSIYAATSPQNVGELTKVVTGELMNAVETISEDEVARARAQLKAGLMMSLESSSARADQIARQLLSFGKVPTPEEIIEKVDQVDAESVRALAKTIFKGAKPSIGAVGALYGLASYDEIAAQFR